MRLKSFSLKNFRGYKDEVGIDMRNLTVFVGQNDIGKSTKLNRPKVVDCDFLTEYYQ